jgi:hypothetical protein
METTPAHNTPVPPKIGDRMPDSTVFAGPLNVWLWSSSSPNEDHTCVQRFSDGHHYCRPKSLLAHVRSVRSTSSPKTHI